MVYMKNTHTVWRHPIFNFTDTADSEMCEQWIT